RSGKRQRPPARDRDGIGGRIGEAGRHPTGIRSPPRPRRHSMTSRTISLTGARGGHGTTTIAAALALFAAGHQRTALVSSDPSTAALIGVAWSGDDSVIEVTPTLALGC